jgi:hypothetical protein
MKRYGGVGELDWEVKYEPPELENLSSFGTNMVAYYPVTTGKNQFFLDGVLVVEDGKLMNFDLLATTMARTPHRWSMRKAPEGYRILLQLPDEKHKTGTRLDLLTVEGFEWDMLYLTRGEQ